MTGSSETPQASATTSDADADADEMLPEDLKPGKGNPLAEPLDPDDESTKDADELGMSDSQNDTTGSYRSSGDLEETDTTSADAASEESGE